MTNDTTQSGRTNVGTELPTHLLKQCACGCRIMRFAAGSQEFFIHACPLHNAAPELLEALEALVADHNEREALYPGTEQQLNKVACFKDARAVIAKATGSTTPEQED